MKIAALVLLLFLGSQAQQKPIPQIPFPPNNAKLVIQDEKGLIATCETADMTGGYTTNPTGCVLAGGRTLSEAFGVILKSETESNKHTQHQLNHAMAGWQESLILAQKCLSTNRRIAKALSKLKPQHTVERLDNYRVLR